MTTHEWLALAIAVYAVVLLVIVPLAVRWFER